MQQREKYDKTNGKQFITNGGENANYQKLSLDEFITKLK